MYSWSVIFILSVGTICVVNSASIASTIRCRSERWCTISNGTHDYVELCHKWGVICCAAPNNEYTLVDLQQNQECCSGSGKIFNKSTEICISGQVRRRLHMEENCGQDQSFNITTEACCHGKDISKVYSLVNGGECCNEDYITSPMKRCCEEEQHFVNNTTCCFKNGSYQLFNISYGKCCDSVAYDPNAYRCSANGLTPSTDLHDIRCGKYPYDQTQSGCCGSAFPKIYNLETQLCYNHHIYDKNKHGDDSVCKSRSKSVTYNKNDKNVACILGRLVQLMPNEAKCGYDKINIENDLCCTGESSHIGVLPGSKCCSGGANAYNPARQSCCLNVVSNEISEESGSRCCSKEAYNPVTHTCNNATRKVENNCHNSQLLSKQCQLTTNKLESIKSTFSNNGKGITVIVATAMDKKTDRKLVQWQLNNVTQIKGKKTIKRESIAKKKTLYFVTSQLCHCLQTLQENQEYLIITDSKFKKKRSKGGSSKKQKNRNSVLKLGKFSHIIPLNDAKNLGHFFSEILRHT